MTNLSKRGLIVGGLGLFVAVAALRSGTRPSQCGSGSCCAGLSTALVAAEASPLMGTNAVAGTNTITPLPRLVDLGANRCIPCKKMAPILEELKTNYAGRLEVEFIDVWKNPDAGKAYKIELIPTQIFFDAAGKEVFRHEGFYAKEDILAKWSELGANLGAPSARVENPKARAGSPKAGRN